MDIRQALLAGHCKRQVDAIVEYIGDDAARFAELMKIFFAGDYRLTQRAAWPMNYCAEYHPELIRPYLPKLLSYLTRKDAHVAARRNIVRLLQYVEIPPRLAARIYSCCVDLVNDPNEPVAVRVFAVTVAARIAKGKPALHNELQLIVSQHLPHATIAFQKRAQAVL
ncbi:MAG: hypothetical protein U0Y68_01850 [Blastocatellia bacterium]